MITKVTPIAGEPLRFFVAASKPTQEPYLVDLESFDFNGACGCDHFDYRLRPHLEGLATDQPRPEILRCKHIEAARTFFFEAQMRSVANHSFGVIICNRTVDRSPAENN